MPCHGCGCSAFSSKEKTDQCGCACHSIHDTDCFWRNKSRVSHEEGWQMGNYKCTCDCHHDRSICNFHNGSLKPEYQECKCGWTKKTLEDGGKA